MKKSTVLKRMITVSLCAAVCASMTACGNNTSDSSTDSTPTSSAADPESTPAEESVPESSDAESPAQESTPYTLGGELTPEMIANSRYNEGNKVRLAKVIKKLQANEEITVAYIGGSITQGSSAGNDLCYARLTTNWLQSKFPEAKINYVNAGVGATGSFYGASRVERDVISHNPDLVFVEFSVNDSTDRTNTNKEAYAALLRKVWASSKSPAIVTIAMTQENGTSFQEHHGEIVKTFDLPMISYKNVILDVIDKGYITWKDISNDNIHPNVPGHALLTDLITNYLQSVIDDVDNISGEESDFEADKYTGMKYINLTFYSAADIEPTKMGGFEKLDQFTNFQNVWVISKTDGQFTEEDAIEFEFEGTRLEVMASKLKSAATKVDVYVDGELSTTIDCNFRNGWGDYMELFPVAVELSEGKHTVKFLPQSSSKGAYFYLGGLIVG